MKRTATITIAIAGLLLAACGSDSSASDSTASDSVTSESAASADGASGAQREAAQRAIDSAAERGVELDEDCVNDVASQLSDEDAEIIAGGGDEQVSAAGAALSLELLGCADEDALTDMFVEGMSESGQDFDEDCVREQLENFDVAELVTSSQGGSPPADVIAAMTECINGG